MIIASSSPDRTVDFGSFGPVGRSATEVRFFPFGNGLVDAVMLGKRSQALLTMLVSLDGLPLSLWRFREEPAP